MPFGIAGTIEPTSCGSMLALMTASGSPPARIISRSTLLRSWRTLPGQSCDCSTAIASSPILRRGRPVDCDICSMKWSTQVGNVLAPFGQRRHADRHHREAVIEILAEAAGGDLASRLRLVDETMRTSTAHLGRAADPLEGLLDQHAQDLALGLARHVGDFVDEQRAAMGLFERADLALLRAVRLLDAEQLDFHALRRDGGGVDDDERAGRARRQRVDGRAASSLPAPEGPTIRIAAVGRRDLSTLGEAD